MNVPRPIYRALYLVPLLIFVALGLGSVLQKSPTYDETVHLFAGYSYLRWGDYRVNPEHPPLVKMLAAAPLLALDLDTARITPRERSVVQKDKNYGWVLAHRFVFADNDAETPCSAMRDWLCFSWPWRWRYASFFGPASFTALKLQLPL